MLRQRVCLLHLDTFWDKEDCLPGLQNNWPKDYFFLHFSICVSFPFPFVTLSEKTECPHHLRSLLWFSSYNIKFYFTQSMISPCYSFCILNQIMVLISRRKEIVKLFRNIFNVLAIFLSQQSINLLLKVCKVINLNSKNKEVFIPRWIYLVSFQLTVKPELMSFGVITGKIIK